MHAGELGAKLPTLVYTHQRGKESHRTKLVVIERSRARDHMMRGRQIAWIKTEIYPLLALQFQVWAAVVSGYTILSLTSLKYHLLETAKISIMFCSSSHQEVGLFPYSLNLSWPYELLWPMEHGGNGVVWVLSLSLKSFAASSIALLGAPKRLPSEDTSSSTLDVENHVAHLLC